MKRTGMPSRAAGIRLCGKPFDSAEAAGLSWRGQQAGARVERCPDKACGKFHVRAGSAQPVPVLPPPRRATGFSARVKLLVRVRAGNGEITDACCESCGRWLGRYGGQIQHIIARGMGGTSRRVLSTAANGALLCGLTPQDADGCHFRAESRNALMLARGFWLPRSADPALESMRLHSGAVVWRSETGSYLFEPPEASAA